MHIWGQQEAIWNTLFSIFEGWRDSPNVAGPGKTSPSPLDGPVHEWMTAVPLNIQFSQGSAATNLRRGGQWMTVSSSSLAGVDWSNGSKQTHNHKVQIKYWRRCSQMQYYISLKLLSQHVCININYDNTIKSTRHKTQSLNVNTH